MKKNVQRILATILTVIMMISMLPSNVFAADFDADMFVEPAVEAVSVPAEEQEVESTVEYIYEEPAETLQGSSDEIQTVEAADPAADEIEEETEAPVVDGTVTLKAEGSDYIVTVTYDVSAGLPADADIKVKEVMEKNKKYDDYVAQAADTIASDVESLNYVRLFDITLVDAAGNELEPISSVDVQIQLKDVDAVQDTTQVVHFAGEEEVPEVVETAVEGDTVSFETDGFSIYAVLAPDEQGNEARLEVTLVLNNGDADIVVLVKPDDITDGEFEKIVYDPGIPEAEGKKFMGWTDAQNYTDETPVMSFDEVREDIKDKLASVKEGDTATYYAMMFNAFELYYVNENNVLFNTVSLMSTADSVTADVTQEYSVTGSTDGFIGWVELGTDEPVYAVGQSITITTAKPQVVLTPKLGPGKWLYFDGNDGGSTAADTASYTPPAFIPQDTPATAYEPADPTRLGYTFDAWYTEAEGGEEFDFSQTLTEDKTVYAHWIPNPEAQYTVIVWAQSVDDNWDAADADKTYGYVESQKFTVATGTQITEDLLRQGGFLSKTDSYFGVTDLEHGSKAFQYRTFDVKNGVGSGKDEVSAMGDTVVNVYYDRKIMTIEFADAPGGTSQTYYEPVDSIEGTEAYGLIGGEYVLLDTVAEKYIEWHSSYTANAYNNVGELASIYWKSGTEYISVSTANIDLTSAEIENVYPRIQQSGTKYTLYGGSSDSTNMYRTAATTNKLYALIKARDPHYYYNGEEYTSQIYAKRTGNVLVYKGLYGQPLSKYGYEWPETNASHQWRSISYIGSFNGSLFGHSNLGGSANKISTSQISATQNTTIIYYMQSTEDESSYTEVARSTYSVDSDQGFMITERFLGSEPSGYRWTTSSTRPTTWTSGTAVDSRGYTTETRGNNSYLHVKYDRVKNDIVFMLGSETVDTIEDIPYGKNLSEYEDDAPEAPEVGENEYFYGWYEDPEGVKEVDWSENMPLANKVIYGITGPVQYHVIIEMNAGGDTVEFGGASQRTEFWLDYGETISGANFMRATRTNSDGDSYSIIGYYTENAEAGQFDNNKLWNFDARVTEQSLAVKYTGPDDPRRVEYGDNGYPNTVGVFKLYASWRDDSLINSGGIHIRYNDGTETFVDPYGYADMATVIVKSELNEANCPEGKYFAGWKLGEVVYLPGQTFSAAKDAAVKESDGYYITLTAEYDDIEEKTFTHIVWYKNDGSGEWYYTSPGLGINESDPIYGLGEGQEIPELEGFNFKGWAKDVEKQNPEDDPNTETEETEANFLVYKDGKYYLPTDTNYTKEITKVAADEMLPYEGLYAIWEEKPFKIYHSSNGEITEVPMPTNKSETFNLAEYVEDGYLYGGYYQYENGVKGDPYPDNGLELKPTRDTTYYLKEVSKQYLKSTIFITYDTNAGHTPQYGLSGLYLIMDIDETYKEYNDFGFIINGDYNDESALISTTTANYACEELVLKDKDTGEKKEEYTLSSFFSGDFVEGDRLAVYEIKPLIQNDEFTLRAFFTTPDGVLVTGIKERTIKTGNLTFENQSWTSQNGINYTAGSDKEAYYESGHGEVGSKSIASGRTYQIKSTPDVLTYTVTKVDDGKNESQVVQAGNNTGKITYAGKTGYIFAGWYLDKAYTKAADFSAVTGDMTVYAKYVKASAMALSFTKKSSKSGSVTLKATLKITGAPDLADAAVSCDYKGKTSEVKFTGVKTTKSGKTTVSTYTGTVSISGLANKASFTAVISYNTPDGTNVTLADKTCKYTSGNVTVK